MKKRVVLILSCLLLSIGFAVAQTVKVAGVVLDDTGETVAGASVVVKGTTTGTITDADGRFSLNVPTDKKTLVISFLGFKPLEVQAKNDLKISLAPDDATVLDDVVVTALGIKKSEKGIGYSISKISADDMQKSGESNVIQGLAAKTSGLMVTSSSGTPGASSKVILRGPATFTGDNQPLIVIDGIPMDNSVNYFAAGDNPYNQTLDGVQTANRAIDLNPDDIESVSVLKGPAAAALYGQAAGNGAIIYTTKKGAKGRGLGITYSSSVELSKYNRMIKLQNRYGQGEDGVYKASSQQSWGEDLIESGAPIYNNVKDFFETGVSYVNNLSISGGDDKSTFRVSVNATNTDGIAPESGLDRYSARLSADRKLRDWFTVGGTMNYTNTKTSLVQNGSSASSIMLGLLRLPVSFNGKDYIDEESGDQKTYFGSFDNPFFSAKYNPYTEETDRLLGNMYTDITLNKLFAISWKVGVDAYNTNGRQVFDYYSKSSPRRGMMSESKYAYRNLNTDFLLKYNQTFGNEEQRFSIAGLAGANYNYKQGVQSFERGTNTSIPRFNNFSAYSNLYVSDQSWYRENKALFLDGTLDYNSIAFLSMTGRYEWSSTFGKNSDGFFYPKVDVSYIFSHLLSDDSFLSYGKLRLAYANVGISPRVYTDRTYFVTPNVADGMTSGWGFPYIGKSGYAKDNVLYSGGLKPERNIGKELGLELKFWDGRIGFDGTFYNQTSRDLLIDQPISPTSGYAYKYVNIGKVQNLGLELGVNADIVKSSDFSWNLALNWSTNKNEVKQLAPGVDELTIATGFANPQSYAIEGEPFGVFYGIKFKRDGSGNLIIGESGLPIQEQTSSKIGDPNPDWLANITNAFRYKDFAFSFLVDIRHGGDVWNGTWSTLNVRGRTAASAERDHDYIIPGVTESGAPNATSISPVAYFGSGYMGLAGSEMDVEDGSWVRLRAVNLSYRFNLLKRNPSSPVQYIELGTTLRNLVLITDYRGGDPETSLTGAGQNLSGYDYYNNPGTKSVLFNVKFGF